RTYTVKDGLKTNMVRAVFLNDADILWVGTTAGIQQLNTRTGEIAEVMPDDPRLASLTTCVHESRGELWVANALGLHVLRGGRWLTLIHGGKENLGKGADRIEFITRDSSGKVWFGSTRSPLRYIEGGELVKLNSELPFVKRSICMSEDREGNLWFGT